jgi:hypothetical protein
MCTVVQFTFDCGHNHKLRKSRCHGKFHKERRDSRKAACCAEPYLITKLSIDCGPCQQIDWEKFWAEKLGRAQIFLAALIRAGMPGVQQVSDQIKTMEDEHNQDAWSIRQKFPPLCKPSSIERVKLRTRAPGCSPLSKEVRPEDVVESRVKSFVEGDDDDDYIRSTDPLHPVTTDYSHPLDNADTSWFNEYLSQEEIKLAESPDIAFDPGSNPWNWDATNAFNSCIDCNGASRGSNIEQNSSELIAWGPDAEPLPSSDVIGMDGVKSAKDEEKATDGSQVAEVLNAFWECIHAGNSTH